MERLLKEPVGVGTIRQWLAATALAVILPLGAVNAAEPDPHAHHHFAPGVIQITPAYIDGLAEQMRTNHPALKAASSQVEVSRADAAAVRSWADPTFQLGGMIAGETMRASRGDVIYGVQQTLPVFGKETQERKAAEARIAVSEQSEEAQFEYLRRDLAKVLLQNAYVSRRVAIVEQDIQWLDELEAVVQAQYSAGNAMQADVLRVQNEKATRVQDLKNEHEMLHHTWFSLNRFLDRPLTNSWPEMRLPELANPVIYNERLVRLAVDYDPRLKVARELVTASGEKVELAKVRRRPNLGVGLQGRTYTGTGEVRSGEIMLSLSLPWFNRERYQQDVVKEETSRRVLEEQLVDMEQQVRHDVHNLTVNIDIARRAALLQRDEILPRTRQIIESLYAAWQSNTGNIRDLLEARRMLLDADLAYARAVATQYQTMSELTLCCGLGDFESLEMIGALPEQKNDAPTLSAPSVKPKN